MPALDVGEGGFRTIYPLSSGGPKSKIKVVLKLASGGSEGQRVPSLVVSNPCQQSLVFLACTLRHSNLLP